MYHYTYKITYTTGKFYMGVRTSKVIPSEDKYIGSSKYTPNDKVLHKEILAEFSTRQEALNAEIAYHAHYDVGINEDYYNRSKQTSTKFDTTGIRMPQTQEHIKKRIMPLVGRKRPIEVGMKVSATKLGVSHGPRSQETKDKISKANKGKDSHAKDKFFTKENRISTYASRVKYSDIYVWKHTITGELRQATCQEMGIDYGKGNKNSRYFIQLMKGTLTKYYGWSYDINLQGSSYKKSIIEFSKQELLTGV